MWAEYAIDTAALFALGVAFWLLVLAIGAFLYWLEKQDDDEPPFDGIVILTPMDELNEMMRRSFDDGWEQRGRMAA